MHTINGVGHVNIYPAAFDFSPNSSLLSAAMDVARGGQFLSIPNPTQVLLGITMTTQHAIMGVWQLNIYIG